MKKYASYTDEKLAVLLNKGAEPAFDEIYRRYWKKLYLAAYRRTGDALVCEELIQDIFASLWTNRHTSAIQNLASYLFSAVKYRVINHMHREMVRKEALASGPAMKIDNSTEEVVLMHDLHEALQKEVSKLPSKCQRVYKLSRENNLSIKQVARELGISEKTVENQLSKALKVLRLNLKHFTCLVLAASVV